MSSQSYQSQIKTVSQKNKFETRNFIVHIAHRLIKICDHPLENKPHTRNPIFFLPEYEHRFFVSDII